jgi:hypothetical protein
MLHLAMWLVAATLSQTPAETGWLEAIPATADIALRARGVEAVRGDLLAMLKAMSPNLSQQAEPVLDQIVAQAQENLGKAVTSQPFLVLARGVTPEGPGGYPILLVVRSSDYETLLKSAAGNKDPKIKHEEGGYDSFAGPGDQTWYAAQRSGMVALGPDKALAAAFKAGEKNLASAFTPALRKSFFSGDVGLYVNAKVLATRYADQLAQAREALRGAMDQAGPQLGEAGMKDVVKEYYDLFFNGIKQADGLVLNLDFASEGLSLGGDLRLKADAPAAKLVAAAPTSDAQALGKLPPDATYYVYMNADAKRFGRLQMMSLRMILPGGKPSPELEAALAQQAQLGRVETLMAMTVGRGLKTLSITHTSDPQKYFESIEAMLKAQKAAAGPMNVVKDVTMTPKVETYRGYTFHRIEMAFDFEKLANAQAGKPADPAFAERMKAMLGGTSNTYWYGIKDRELIQLSGSSWDQAKAQLDAYLNGAASIGTTPGFQAARGKLAKQATVVGLINTQGLVRMIGSINDPAYKLPDSVPKDPAFAGVSLTPNDSPGYELHFVIPSPVGAVIEKGLVPVIQALPARARQ